MALPRCASRAASSAGRIGTVSGSSTWKAHSASACLRRRCWPARRACPHDLAPLPAEGAVASVETETLPVVLISDAPATARDFDVPRRRAPSAGTLDDMTEVRPHQPTTYDIRGGRRPVRTFSSPSPSGPLARSRMRRGSGHENADADFHRAQVSFCARQNGSAPKLMQPAGTLGCRLLSPESVSSLVSSLFLA